VTQVRVREVTGTLHVVDGDALLTGPMLERIVTAVLAALGEARRDDESRRRCACRGGACCDGCESGEGA
jgi:hypothetical protein